MHNSKISNFSRFSCVDNFCTIFRVIHIFPHYSTWFVQFAKSPFFSTFFPENYFYFSRNKADKSASNSLNPLIFEGLVTLCAPDAVCFSRHIPHASGRILAERFCVIGILRSNFLSHKKELPSCLHRNCNSLLLFHISSNTCRCLIIIIRDHNSLVSIQCMHDFTIADI